MIFLVHMPNNGKVGNPVLCPHSRFFGSYFDVIFWCILCLLSFLSSQPHPHQSSSSTQFSQEWVVSVQKGGHKNAFSHDNLFWLLVQIWYMYINLDIGGENSRQHVIWHLSGYQGPPKILGVWKYLHFENSHVSFVNNKIYACFCHLKNYVTDILATFNELLHNCLGRSKQ